MKLYTSYFYQIRNFPRNLIPLSTAVWPPKYPIKDSTGQPAILIDCWPMKPGSQCAGLCDGSCDPKHPNDCKFLKTYRAQLDAIEFDKFYTQLEILKKQIEEGEGLENVDFAFVVFESPRNPCSERTVIQAWGASLGIEIKEWSES